MNSASSFPIGTLICHMRIGTPRPASNRSFWSPASTSVLGPNRLGRGDGEAVPSSVTLKSDCACAFPIAASASKIASRYRIVHSVNEPFEASGARRLRQSRDAHDSVAMAGQARLMPPTTQTQLNPFLTLAPEMGPLLLFFFANARPAPFMPL